MLTLAALANEFLSESELSPSTLKSYRSTLTPFVKKYGAIAINLIDKKLIRSYLSSLSHLGVETHNRHQTIVKRLFNYAIEEEYIERNPVLGIKKRQPDPSKGEHKSDTEIRYLDSQQLAALYEVLEKNAVKPEIFRLYCIVSLLHTSGARIAEVLQLEVNKIDWQERKFTAIGKGNKKRWCFYGEKTALLLGEYLEDYRYEGVSALFTAKKPKSKKVTQVSYRKVNQDWKNTIAPKDIIKNIRLHDLRHTYATERVGLMAIEELRALMGHENIQTTLRYQKITSLRSEEVAKFALLKLKKSVN